MSLLGGLLSFIPGVGPLLGMGADMLGAAGKSAAANRGTRIDAALEGQKVANQTDQQNINSRQSAWKDLMKSDYVLNNNRGYTAPTFKSSTGMPDRTLPSFGIARNPYGSGMVNSAMGIQNELMQRLQNGPQLHAPNVAQMSKPGLMEKILNIAGPAMGVASQFKRRTPGVDDGTAASSGWDE